VILWSALFIEVGGGALTKMMSCELYVRRFASKISFTMGEETRVFVSSESSSDPIESISSVLSRAESGIAYLKSIIRL